MLTPASQDNPSGLSTIAYRAGTWSSFKESMLARLSSSDYPALQPLKTRSDDDFTGALSDASAMMLDVLTFYQERLANEGYLRTAGQLRSLTELSRLIGYQPAPGVSASSSHPPAHTYLWVSSYLATLSLCPAKPLRSRM